MLDFSLPLSQVVALAVVAHRMHAMGVIDLQRWLPSGLVQLAGLQHTCGLRNTDHLILTSSRVVFPEGVRPGAGKQHSIAIASRCRMRKYMSEGLHNPVEATIDLCRYP